MIFYPSPLVISGIRRNFKIDYRKWYGIMKLPIVQPFIIIEARAEKERTNRMGSLDGNIMNSISGGEVFFVYWLKSDKKSFNIVLNIQEDDFYFVELGKGDYWTRYETLIEEVQPKEDIVDYLEFLYDSEEVNVQFLGKMNKDETYRNILSLIEREPNLDWRPNKKASISKSVNDFLSSIRKLHTVQQEIDNLPIKSGDVIYSFSSKGHLIGKERLTQVGDKFVILPIKRKVNVSEDEKMTNAELFEYLFYLVVEEKSTLVWDSTFYSQKGNIAITLSDKNKILEQLS